MEGRFRSRYGRVAVARAALVVFLLFCALIAGIVFTLDLSARRSNSQQAATELAGTARVEVGVGERQEPVDLVGLEEVAGEGGEARRASHARGRAGEHDRAAPARYREFPAASA